MCAPRRFLPGSCVCISVPAGYKTTGPIAFSHVESGVAHIFLVRTDGSHLVRLTSAASSDTEPAWSPSGAKIAFTRTPVGGSPSIFIMHSDGTHLVRIARNASSAAWSETGTIAFVRQVNGSDDIWTMASDGTGQTDQITGPAKDYQPSWSPDGSKLAFTSDRTGSPNIFTANPDGSWQTQLTTDSYDEDPVWDPGGASVIYDHFTGIERVPCSAWPAGTFPTSCWQGPEANLAIGAAGSSAWQAASSKPLQVFANDSLVSPGPGRSFDPAWQPMTVALRQEDHVPQTGLNDALAAAISWGANNGGVYGGADGTSSTGLVTVDPSLCYVGPTTRAVSSGATCAQGTGEAAISIYTYGQYSWAAAAKSSSGTCFYLKSDFSYSPPLVTYGWEFGTSLPCDGAQANTTGVATNPWWWT